MTTTMMDHWSCLQDHQLLARRQTIILRTCACSLSYVLHVTTLDIYTQDFPISVCVLEQLRIRFIKVKGVECVKVMILYLFFSISLLFYRSFSVFWWSQKKEIQLYWAKLRDTHLGVYSYCTSIRVQNGDQQQIFQNLIDFFFLNVRSVPFHSDPIRSFMIKRRYDY